jgi:hypothetical protein
MLRKIVAIALLCGWAAWDRYGDRSFHIETGIPLAYPTSYTEQVSIDSEPYQEIINGGAQSFRYREYRITPLAVFQLEARVLGKKTYRHGRETELSRVDLALGWGPMARQEIVGSFEISQGGRFYSLRTHDRSLLRGQIVRNSANMHLIPASTRVTRELERVEPDERVRLKGYLVEINADDGWHWRSSLSRDDTGNGACELILVDDVRRL